MEFLDLCLTEIKALANSGLINFLDGSNKITSKLEGEIMARYLISFATMKTFTQVCIYQWNIQEHVCNIENVSILVKEYLS